MTKFLRLDDFLLPPPLPAVVAVLMCLGLKYCGNKLVLILRRSSPQPLESAAGFMFVTGLVAFLSNLMAIFGLAYVWPLRTIAWGIAGCGIIELSKLRHGYLTNTLLRLRNLFHEQALWGKIGILLVLITLICLCFAALGPPTDMDSLDYHLGLPLDILRHHQAYPRPDWLHSRLAGLGESLNMLGLAAGTDIFGASLQFSGLLVALVAVKSLAKTDFDRILAVMIVIGCPVFLWLIPSQKPQMLPTAATTIALIIIVRRFQSIDAATIVLAFGSVCFAMSCKYSFLLSGSVVIGTGMIAAYKSGKLNTAVYIALGGLVFLLPIYLQKLIFYGDPMSPMLERFLSGDLAVVEFANSIKNYRDTSMAFPLLLIFPDSIRTINMTLGLGALLVFVAPIVHGSARVLVICALISAVLTFFMGQRASRFFLEPYLWIAAAFVATNASKVKPVFFKIMLVQMAEMAAMAVFAAVILFPGALSGSFRDQVMLRSSHQYGESKWLDSLLPKDAVVLTDMKSKALIPRPFMSSDKIYSLISERDSQELGKLSSIFKRHGINTWITSTSLPSPYLRTIFPILVTEPKFFRTASKNPWNASISTTMVFQSVQE